jgi:hypothetical protein
MPLDKDDLAAISNAVAEKMGSSMQTQFDQFKESMENAHKSQAENLGRMDEIFTSLLKKQESFEEKSDKKFSELENTLTDRQDNSERENNEKFCDIQKQLSNISEKLADKASPTPFLPFPGSAAVNPPPSFQPQQPPHPALLPIPTFASSQQQQIMLPQQQQHSNLSDIASIKEIVDDASTILGFGPISAEDIEDADGDNPEEKILSAAIDYLRNEIAVKEEEINDSDILKVFPASDPDLQRIYVKFSNKEQAALCLDLTRRLRKPELKVVLYIPRQLRQRFMAIKNEEYRLRKMTEPKHKTRIQYSDSDLVLHVCPLGHYRYVYHPIPDLPPADLAPVRTHPQGRKSKKEMRDKRPRP